MNIEAFEAFVDELHDYATENHLGKPEIIVSDHGFMLKWGDRTRAFRCNRDFSDKIAERLKAW